jgi:hypothetical protein
MYANGGMGAGATRVPMYAQELYAQADGAFSAAAQMQQQYLANYNPAIPQPPAAALNQLAAASVNLQAAAVAAVAAANATAASAAGNATNSGPSANNRKLGLYKTELCRSWEEKGTCRYGTKCQFAHGEDELRQVQRHPKYKTEVCRVWRFYRVPIFETDLASSDFLGLWLVPLREAVLLSPHRRHRWITTSQSLGA